MRLTKKDVAVVALASLGGATSEIDTEDAAIAAHAIAPTAFGWKKHTEHIDLDAVRMTLRHEAEATNARIGGSIRQGWHLTSRGTAWVDANRALLDGAELTVAETPAATQRHRAETRETGAVLNRIRTSDAFRQWAEGAEVTPRQAAEVFRIDEYTPDRDRTHKTARLQELAKGDKDIEEFMKMAIAAALELRAPTSRRDGK
ncbi:hypothetical protein [Oerskovia paurometabola]|uniref:hypothetical protein n=1 Tax=Oerskovia paurometabola TaxID=162170 RepID=UPI00342C3627